MPRVAAQRLIALLIAGVVWSVACALAGVDFWFATRGSCSEDFPPIIVTGVLALTTLGLRKGGLFILFPLHGVLAFCLLAASVVRAFEGHVPLAHTVMMIVMAAIPVYVLKWRHCFDWDR
jgi:hypothetical protein